MILFGFIDYIPSFFVFSWSEMVHNWQIRTILITEVYF